MEKDARPVTVPAKGGKHAEAGFEDMGMSFPRVAVAIAV